MFGASLQKMDPLGGDPWLCSVHPRWLVSLFYPAKPRAASLVYLFLTRVPVLPTLVGLTLNLHSGSFALCGSAESDLVTPRSKGCGLSWLALYGVVAPHLLLTVILYHKTAQMSRGILYGFSYLPCVSRPGNPVSTC